MACGTDCDATIRDCLFSGNSATNGGGFDCQWSRPVLIGCVFSGNDASFGGGARVGDQAEAQFEDCIFQGNTALSGGGLFAKWSLPVIQGCAFEGNEANGTGGGIGAKSSAEPQIAECTFSGNTAITGGGVSLVESSVAGVTSCTFYANESTFGGGLAAFDYSTVMVDRCIIAGSSQGAALRCFNSVAILNCNDFFDNVEGDFVDCAAGMEGVSGNICADPLFCDPELGDLRLRDDSPCLPESNPLCGLVGAKGMGCTGAGVGEGAQASRMRLEAFPSPFRGSLEIRLVLPGAGRTVDPVQAGIFDSGGRALRSLRASPGEDRLFWDGRDDDGKELPAGVYYVRVNVPGNDPITGMVVRLR